MGDRGRLRRTYLTPCIFVLSLVVAGVAAPDDSVAQTGERDIRRYDRIVRKTGTPIEGEILEETATKINFELPNGIRFTIDRSEVVEILRRNPPETAYVVSRKRTKSAVCSRSRCW